MMKHDQRKRLMVGNEMIVVDNEGSWWLKIAQGDNHELH